MKAERALQEEEEGERDELLRLRVRGEADYAQVGVNEVDAKSLPHSPTTKVGLGGLFPLRPNADFPAMSERLEVAFQPGKGRHVIAKCDIQERFQILVISVKYH